MSGLILMIVLFVGNLAIMVWLLRDCRRKGKEKALNDLNMAVDKIKKAKDDMKEVEATMNRINDAYQRFKDMSEVSPTAVEEPVSSIAPPDITDCVVEPLDFKDIFPPEPIEETTPKGVGTSFSVIEEMVEAEFVKEQFKKTILCQPAPRETFRRTKAELIDKDNHDILRWLCFNSGDSELTTEMVLNNILTKFIADNADAIGTIIGRNPLGEDNNNSQPL